MTRILWVLSYAVIALRSQWVFGPISAVQEGWASYEMNDAERGAEPMPTPLDAFLEDGAEWRYG